jgi:hypothetical protein
MTIFQLVALLFALFMMYVVSIHYKKKTLSLMEVSWWYSIWFIFVVISLFPNLLLGVVHALNFARVFDLLVVAALMVLSILVFVNYFAQKEANRKLEKYVRQDAIRSAQLKTKKVK